MSTSSIDRLLCDHFSRIGAELVVRRPDWSGGSFSIDIERIGRHERFVIVRPVDLPVNVVDIQSRDRHLLLMVRPPKQPRLINPKYLCGHDERHYFAAAVPELAGASTVVTAKEALKPKEIVDLEKLLGVKPKNRHARRRRLGDGSKIFRQGEFMFVPQPDFVPKLAFAVLRDEPLTRSRFLGSSSAGNPHIARELYQENVESIYSNHWYPEGLTESERTQLIQDVPEARGLYWRVRSRDPIVHVRGTIRHVEHSTIDLGRVWHRVYLNTEHLSGAGRYMAYID